MQDREKKLAIGLGVVVVLAFAMPLFDRWFLLPLTEANNQVLSSLESVGKLQTSVNDLKRAERNLEEWQYESLPPNPFTAQREYQEWLTDLARMSGLTSLEVTLGNVPNAPTRGQTYIEIPVTLHAKATLEHLARFLYHFERVALLHQVQTLDVISPASIGNPLLDVTISARGLSLVDAPPHSRLFPTNVLLEDVAADSPTLALDSLKGFPTIDGFQIKIDEELMSVQKLGENELTVQRGAEETVAVEHPAGSVVELFPVDQTPSQNGRTFEEYVELLQNSPFTKPSPPIDYDSKLSPQEAQTVTRGEPWKLQMSLSGWDPSGGPAVYSLEGDVPAGLTIDAQTGELTWDPGKQIEARQYDVTVLARSNILSGRQTQVALPVTLREPNLPPTIEAIKPLTAFSGRPLSVDVKADDPDGDNQALQYSLTGEVPAGAAIDKTGVLQWIPPLTLELGDYKLSVQVADSGDPQKTTTQEVAVKLEDDAALFTQLTGFFAAGNKPEAMLRNLTSGKTSRLSEGDEVTAAEIQGTIVGIEPNHIVLKVGEQRYRLNLGDNLRQMKLMESAESQPPTHESPSES